jgi:aconitate hydratase
MRAKAGAPPSTISQKILGARQRGTSKPGEPVQLAVDQIVITDGAESVLADAKIRGLGAGIGGSGGAGKKTPVELGVIYDGHAARQKNQAEPFSVREALAHGLVISRPGMGFAPPVHAERFASPARLCVTDSPRMVACGGVSMLTLAVTAADLGQALATGMIHARMPVTVSVQLTGRLRPFVSAVDVALELVRRGSVDVIQKARAKHGVPVVLEFGGPAVRHFSIPERAHIAQIATEIAAASAVFPADERTQVYLRDQRRSKAHRTLASDAGSDLADVISLDVGAIDPLVRDSQGVVRPVRDLAGTPVETVLLGGDGGASMRDVLTFAALLKSKRVHEKVALLFAPPSRQILEVVARSGGLSDLISTGARLVEPDLAVLSQQIYPGVQLRTCLGPQNATGTTTFTASPETCAHAVTRGELGDPRGQKRVVRVTVPRELPTDDVLIVRR